MPETPNLDLYRRAFLEVLWEGHARRWHVDPTYLLEKLALAFTARRLSDLRGALDGDSQRRFEERVGQLTSEIKHLAPQIEMERDTIAHWAFKAGRHRGQLEALRAAARDLLAELRRVDEADLPGEPIDELLVHAAARVAEELTRDVDAPLGEPPREAEEAEGGTI